MSSSSSTSSSGVSTYSGLKMAGLVSGLDTETLVKQMASLTKSRINTQQQKLQKLLWKQESYRGVTSKIKTFSENYLNNLKPETNIKSNSLMAAYKSVASNSKVTASATASATAATYTVTSVQQLAKAASIEANYGEGGATLTKGIKMDFAAAASGQSYSINLTLDGLSKDVTFTAGADAEASKTAFMAAVKDTFGSAYEENEGVQTKGFTLDSDGNFKYTADDGIAHSYIISQATDAYKGDANEVSKQENALRAIGVEGGSANRVQLSSKLGAMNFTTELKGDSFSFTINDVDFSFDKDTSIKDMMSQINSSAAGVKVNFNSLSQTFSMESTTDGTASSIKMTQTGGNLLNSLFGNDIIGEGGYASPSIKAGGVYGDTVNADEIKDMSAYKNSQLSVTVNGVTKNIGLWGYNSLGEKNDLTTDDDKSAMEKAVSVLNTELKTEFGSSAPSFTIQNNRIVLSGAKNGDSVTINSISNDERSEALFGALGFDKSKGYTNVINENSLVQNYMGTDATGTFRIGDSEITIDATTTFKDLQEQLGENGVVDLDRGTVTAFANMSADDAAGKKSLESIFGKSYDELSAMSISYDENASTITRAGQNAILTVNGVTISNASNDITIDGTTFNIGKLTSADGVGQAELNEEITVTTSRDTTKAFDAVVKFVNDYNTLISDLNKEISTARPKYQNKTYYEPLTEEQEEDMTDKQIEQWTEKAKTGMIYQDSTISNFLTKLRTAINTRTSDNFSLYDMGITVSSEYKDNGKLEIDEAKLKQAFESYPDKIQELFTDTENGLAANVTTAINSAISTSRSDGYGSLVMMAGIENTASASDNTISKQITDYQDVISSLQERYEDEMERYWNKFTALETMMAKYSQQASYFETSN